MCWMTHPFNNTVNNEYLKKRRRQKKKKNGLRTAWEKENVLLLDEGVNWNAYEIEYRRIRNIYGNLKSKWLCFFSLDRSIKFCHSIFFFFFLLAIVAEKHSSNGFTIVSIYFAAKCIELCKKYISIKLQIKLIRLLRYSPTKYSYMNVRFLMPSAHWFTKWNVSERESRMKYLYVIDIWIRCYWIYW